MGWTPLALFRLTFGLLFAVLVAVSIATGYFSAEDFGWIGGHG